MHWATKRDHCHIVEFLLNSGAEPSREASNGKLAADHCRSDEMKSIYKKHGVQLNNATSNQISAGTSFVPNYIRYPLKTKELDEVERAVDREMSKQSPLQQNGKEVASDNLSHITSSSTAMSPKTAQRKEFFVYQDRELRECQGSVRLDPSVTSVDELLNIIHEQLDMSVKNMRLFKYVTERKLLVPVGARQFRMLVLDIFSDSDSDIVIIV